MTEYFRIAEIILSCIILSVCSVIDIRTKRIPSRLNFVFLLLACSVLAVSEILDFRPWALFLRILMFVLLFFFGMTGIIGIGDIKLLMSLSLLNDPLYIIGTVFLGCVGVVLAALLRAPKNTVKHLRQFLHVLTVTKSVDAATPENKTTVPFVPYLATGYVIMLCAELILPAVL